MTDGFTQPAFSTAYLQLVDYPALQRTQRMPRPLVVVAESPDDQARALVELLRDRERREAIGHRARELVLRKYTWARIGSDLRELYHWLVDPRIDVRRQA